MSRLATILALMIAGPAAGQSDGDVTWNTGRLPDGPGHAAEIAYEDAGSAMSAGPAMRDVW